MLRHFFGAHNDGKNRLDIAAAAKEAIIKDFFSAKLAASSCAVEWSRVSCWAWINNSLLFSQAAVSFGGEYSLARKLSTEMNIGYNEVMVI